MPVTNDELREIVHGRVDSDPAAAVIDLHDALKTVAAAVLEDRETTAARREAYKNGKGGRGGKQKKPAVVRCEGRPVEPVRIYACGKCGMEVARFHKRDGGAAYDCEIEELMHQGTMQRLTGYNWFHNCPNYRGAGR